VTWQTWGFVIIPCSSHRCQVCHFLEKQKNNHFSLHFPSYLNKKWPFLGILLAHLDWSIALLPPTSPQQSTRRPSQAAAPTSACYDQLGLTYGNLGPNPRDDSPTHGKLGPASPFQYTDHQTVRRHNIKRSETQNVCIPATFSRVPILTSSCPSRAIFLQEIRKSPIYTWAHSDAFPWLLTAKTYHSVHAFDYKYDVKPRTFPRRRFRKIESRPKLSDAISAGRLDRIARGFLQAITEDHTIPSGAALFFFAHGFGGLICEQVRPFRSNFSPRQTANGFRPLFSQHARRNSKQYWIEPGESLCLELPILWQVWESGQSYVQERTISMLHRLRKSKIGRSAPRILAKLLTCRRSSRIWWTTTPYSLK